MIFGLHKEIISKRPAFAEGVKKSVSGMAAAVLLSLRQLRRNRSRGCGQDCASCMAACQRKKEA